MTKTDALIEALGSAIVGGDLPAGSVLAPDALQIEYGVSRTVVREAVQTLKDKALVTVRPYMGTVVTPRASWRMLDPDVVRWTPEGGWLRRDMDEFLDEVRMLAAAKPHNAVMAHVVRALARRDETR